MKYEIEFNEARHEYRVNGIIKPSVSQVIKQVLEGGGEIPEYAKGAVARGVYAHKAIQLLNCGQLDNSKLEDEIEYDTGVVKTYISGYLESFSKFKDKYGLIPKIQEVIGYDPENDVCGTIDEIPVIDGASWIVDHKTGAIYPKYTLQIVGYKTMVMNMVGRERMGEFMNHRIGALQLFKEGKMAKLHEYDWLHFRRYWDAVCDVYKLKNGGVELCRR